MPQDPPPPTSNPQSVSPHTSSTPLITQEQRTDLRNAGASDATDTPSKDSKSLKDRLLSLAGKKKEDPKMNASASEPVAAATGDAPSQATLKQQQQQRQPDLKAQPQPIHVSPLRNPLHPNMAASPSRLRSSSPRLHSPASSEIFERNVQEPIPISTLEGELSPAHIPAHVITEDSIPPALEASAQAITSEDLNPDQVEIVTSSSHQPAATVLESATSHTDLTSLSSPPVLRHDTSDPSSLEAGGSLHASGILPGTAEDDGASNYGQLDPNDVRRLSFISFKDIVQSEHQQLAAGGLGDIAGSRDSLHISGVPVGSIGERAASPLRSPRSPTSTHSSSKGGVTTPPPGVNVNSIADHTEQSPVRSIGLGSPASQHGELTIETMRQSIRKTASGDLSQVRSPGMSPVGEENSFTTPRSRTNT